jgi:putative sterol carrier protein
MATMPKFLTQEWMDRARELAADFPETPGASVRLQQVVTGAPGGDVTYHTVIEDGRTLVQALGEDPEGAEVTLTNSYEDAVQVLQGELDASAAFMQGRIKVTGNMAKMMALLPVTSTPEYRQLQERLRAETQL